MKMFSKKLLFVFLALSTVCFSYLNAAQFSASFTDKNLWNGKKVPEEMVCSDYNFEAGSTPEISLTNVPKYTRKIILSFNDKTFTKMDNGGHGVLAYKIDVGATKVDIPSIKGETYDLPDEFESIQEHTGTRFGKEEGAYLAPCSGGKGNTYTVLIQAVDRKDNVLASTTLVLGKY